MKSLVLCIVQDADRYANYEARIDAVLRSIEDTHDADVYVTHAKPILEFQDKDAEILLHFDGNMDYEMHARAARQLKQYGIRVVSSSQQLLDSVEYYLKNYSVRNDDLFCAMQEIMDFYDCEVF